MMIHNRFIPFKGFTAINLFGVIFVRRGHRVDRVVLNHERIHTAQMCEMLYIFFYLWYLVEWLVRLPMRGNAYRNISFEREAYANETNMAYLEERQPYSALRYYLHHRR